MTWVEGSVEPAGGRKTQPTAGHLAAIVNSSDDAILSKDSQGIITSWNPGAERIYGYTAEEAIGRPISILIPEHRVGEERRILDQVLAGNRVDHYETERMTKDGRMLFVSLTVSPVRDAEGTVVAASVIARDVTRNHRMRQLASRLQEVSTALSRELTGDGVVDVVLDEVVAGLDADAGAIGLLAGDEVVLAGTVGYPEWVSEWERFPLDLEAPMSQSIRDGQAVWTGSARELSERYPILGQRELGFPALAVHPLVVAGEPFGALSLGFRAEREFDPEERSFVAAAAQQAAYALSRARMFEAQREIAEHQRLLADAGELLAGSLDPDATLIQLADLSVRHIADWCAVELLEESGKLRSVAIAHADPERLVLANRLREQYPSDPEARVGPANVIRTGVSELHPTIDDELLATVARDPEQLEALRELGLRSAMIVPLKARGRVFGAITFVSSTEERRYGAEDLRLADDLARRTSLAVDNALLFRREHEAAVTLQRSLLPKELPKLAGITFDARYQPAAPGIEVGGDWYEVVALDDGTVAVTIGDVAGRGIRAASVMGRIRPALRAYVLEGHGPRDALVRLDRLIKEFDRPEMTTVLHLHFDPARGVARYVRAGHPPGLLRTVDGAVSELAGGGTPPLGILEGIDCREHEIELPPQSLLLLYTDGLIERRHGDLLSELEQLERSLAAAPNGAAECLDWLSSQLSADQIPDDVAMVAMALGGEQRESQ